MKSTNRFDLKYPLLNSLICYKGNNFGRYYDENPETLTAIRDSAIKKIESIKHEYPKAAAYLNGSLHDSEVIAINKTDDSFSIIYNDFPMVNFVSALCEVERIRKKNIHLHLEMKFKNLVAFKICKISNNQKILPIKFTKHKPHIKGFLYEEIIEFSKEMKSLGFLLWSKKGSQYVLLEITCEEIEFIEMSRFRRKRISPSFSLDTFHHFY